MNPFSPYQSTPSDILFKRFRLWKRQYLHIVIYTSLFWIFIDVFFIMLFSDCTKEVITPCPRTSALSADNHSHTVHHSLPVQPTMGTNRRQYRNRTRFGDGITNVVARTSAIRRWWEIEPGLNYKLNNKADCFAFRHIRRNQST